MTESYLLRRRRIVTLTTQIAEVEQRVLNRKISVSLHSNLLVRKFYRQLTSPRAFLMSSIIGFIFGELTKSSDSARTSKSAQLSPLTTALNLIISLRTIYMALPITWILKSFKQRRQVPDREFR
jgi:hypothetical protein